MAILWNNRPRRFIIFLHLRFFIIIFSFFCFLIFLFFMILKNDFSWYLKMHIKGNSIRLFLCFMHFFSLTYKREVDKAISLFFHLKTKKTSFIVLNLIYFLFGLWMLFCFLLQAFSLFYAFPPLNIQKVSRKKVAYDEQA